MHPSDPRDPPDADAETQAAVQTLLAAQPDPGPMPADVVARLETALSHAATRRAADDELFDELGFGDPAAQVPEEDPETIVFERHAAAGEDDGSDGRVVPFPRRRWPVLAAAAAAVVLVGGGAILGLVQIRRGAEAVAAIPGANATPFAGTTHVQVSNTAYTKASLPTSARALVTNPGPDASSGDAPSVGPLATASGLDSCISGLKQNSATSVSVDLATYEGSPAAVLVVRKDDTLSAYVVERDCSNADPSVIQDAVPVP